MAIDPICGMTVDEQKALHAEVSGQKYYFCCEHCRTTYLKQVSELGLPPGHSGTGYSGNSGFVPLTTLSAGQSTEVESCCHGHEVQTVVSPHSRYFCPMCPGVESAGPGDCPRCGMSLEQNPTWTANASGTKYVCPMHPEIQQDNPGDCPICGMALEPVAGMTAAEDGEELRDLTGRLWLAAGLTIPVFLLAMSHLIPGLGEHSWTQGPVSRWMQFLLSIPVVTWAGWPLLRRGWRSLVTRHLNMFTLIAIGVGAAYVYSGMALMFPELFPQQMRHGGRVGVYFEAAAMIITLVLLGQILELRARNRTGHAIRGLLELAPPTARRVTAGGDQVVSLGSVRVDDRLRVVPGDRIPVDGIVVEGQSTVEESMMTGEPTPVPKKAGDKLIAGTMNNTGSLVMKAERVGSQTLLGQIVAMVAESQRSRAPIQSLADQVASVFVPAVLLVSALTFASWFAWGPEPRLTYGLVNAVAVLIIACPCALGLATPMSIMVGIGRGAQTGILVRNAEVLERLEKVSTLVIDKTGTVTEGRPRVVGVQPVGGQDRLQLIKLAASLEQNSEHPLASALVQEAKQEGLNLTKADSFQADAGKGIQGEVNGHRLRIGSLDYLREADVTGIASLEAAAMTFQTEGQTAVFAACDGASVGIFSIADPVKPTASKAISELKGLGLKVVMVTGDNQRTAHEVARQIGIDQVQAQVTPTGKAAFVTQLQQGGEQVVFAGDGINDAPALSAAAVGIAMETGTDIAIQSAGVTLLKGDLQGISRAIRLSRATMANIRENLFFAFAYNVISIPVAAGILYPFFGILLSPVIAGAAMSLSSVSVIGNALRLQQAPLDGRDGSR